MSKTLADGTLASYTYDAANRLTTLNHTLSGASFARFDYGYDNVNRRTYEQRDSAAGDTFSYDAVDQLASVNYDATNPSSGASGTDRTVGYTYDAVGNRTAVNDSVNGNAGYTANADNQYTAVGGAAYGYDGNGNLVSGNGLYFYDAQNRLTYAQVGGTIEQIAYDSRNRVVSRTVNGTATYFIYDGWDLIEERNSSGAVLASYVHGARQDELLSKTTPAGTVYYQHNALGSVTDLTNASGAVVEKYKYDAFGKPAIADGSGNPLTTSAYGNRLLFTGREFLAEVNLYDYRNRVYSADLGRFLQTDPMRFAAGDVNIYRYCGNNPLNKTDAMGLDCGGSNGANNMTNPDPPSTDPIGPPAPTNIESNTTTNTDGSTTTTTTSTNPDGSQNSTTTTYNTDGTSKSTDTNSTSTSTPTQINNPDGTLSWTTTTTTTSNTTTTTYDSDGNAQVTIAGGSQTTSAQSPTMAEQLSNWVTTGQAAAGLGNVETQGGMEDGLNHASSE